MKLFLTVLAISALCASAQTPQGYVQGVNIYNAVTNNPLNSVTNPANPLISLGVSNNIAVYNTNLSTAIAKTVPIGPNGFGITINAGGSTALAITNMGLTFEYTADGRNWATNVLRISYSPMGVNYAPFVTNITPAVFPNIGNMAAVRLKEIRNTNSEAVIITNILISTR